MFDSWSGDATGNANPLIITMDGDKTITANYLKNRVYVDLNATGANNGTSWNDAYTSLQTALNNNSTSDFWVSLGTYIPGASRTDSFTLTDNQTIYGLERHRLLWLYLKNETDFFSKTLKVLHFAPEQCFLKRFRALKNLDYTTTDLLSPTADVKADISNLPFDDNSYDVILCNHVLEHISDDTKAMEELHRVLKPGGWGVFQIPQDLNREKTFEDNAITDRKERARIFGQYDHVRIYGRDYFNKLRSIGFKVDEINYTETLGTNAIAKFRLASGEIIPLVRK